MHPGRPVLRLTRPSAGREELRQLRGVLQSGCLSDGPKVREFEDTVAGYLGVRYALATNSCTTALHLALEAVGVGPGDEVLVPDFTFPSTANVVVHLGARPVLVDIDLETFNVSVRDLARKATKRSKAVVPVHLFGLPADMGSILRLSLPVVEDAACALGAKWNGKPCGTIGDVGCFSFHPRKIITTGEGGVLATDDNALAERVLLMRDNGGLREGDGYIFREAGFNYLMSDFQAAVGVAQMRKLNGVVRKRNRLARLYDERLAHLDGLGLPPRPEGSVCQTYVVLLPERANRDGMIGKLKREGVETAIGTYALHAQPYFRHEWGHEPGDLPNSWQAYRRTLALPLHPGMSEGDVGRVTEALEKCLKGNGSSYPAVPASSAALSPAG